MTGWFDQSGSSQSSWPRLNGQGSVLTSGYQPQHLSGGYAPRQPDASSMFTPMPSTIQPQAPQAQQPMVGQQPMQPLTTPSQQGPSPQMIGQALGQPSSVAPMPAAPQSYASPAPSPVAPTPNQGGLTGGNTSQPLTTSGYKLPSLGAPHNSSWATL